MKTTLIVSSLSLLVLNAACAQSLQAAVISAGAARLDNGSVVNIGQPFVGVMAGSGGASLSLGIIPSLVEPPPPPKRPPRLFSPTIENGVLRLTFEADPGWQYTLEESTDLINWTTLISTAELRFELPLPQSGYVFYRVAYK